MYTIKKEELEQLLLNSYILDNYEHITSEDIDYYKNYTLPELLKSYWL